MIYPRLHEAASRDVSRNNAVRRANASAVGIFFSTRAYESKVPEAHLAGWRFCPECRLPPVQAQTV
jgi:hypothetical protein